MEWCSKCGNDARLSEVISDNGIVSICENCLIEGNFPIIKKQINSEIKEVEKKESVYERLSRMSGIDPKNEKEKKELKAEEDNLKHIVNKNYDKRIKEHKNNLGVKRPDLIDNFHWIIMRARRAKKLTQDQLAVEIAEPPNAIKMVEEGILPKEDYTLLKKLENYLDIKIIEKENYTDDFEKLPEEFNNVKKFSKFSGLDFESKNLTIADLQDMKRKKEEEILKRVDKKYFLKDEEEGDENEKI